MAAATLSMSLAGVKNVYGAKRACRGCAPNPDHFQTDRPLGRFFTVRPETRRSGSVSDATAPTDRASRSTSTFARNLSAPNAAR